LTRTPEAPIPMNTVKAKIVIPKVNTALKKSAVSFLSFLLRYPLKVGIKAAEIVPSAKSRLKRFGIKKATVPRNAAFTDSLKRPKTLDIKVKPTRT